MATLAARSCDPCDTPHHLAGSGHPGQWVNRLGIALLLLGAAFGFKYSIDHGWIGPARRVLFGLGLGVVLLAASASVRRTRPGLSRVLAGVIVVALGTWRLAVIREMLCAEDPARWRPTTFGFGEAGLVPQRAGRRDTQTHQLALVTPLLVLVLSAWL